MIIPKITKVYTPDVLIIHYSIFFFLATLSLSYILLNIFYHITLLTKTPTCFLNNFVFIFKELASKNKLSFSLVMRKTDLHFHIPKVNCIETN